MLNHPQSGYLFTVHSNLIVLPCNMGTLFLYLPSAGQHTGKLVKESNPRIQKFYAVKMAFYTSPSGLKHTNRRNTTKSMYKWSFGVRC